MKILQLGKFYPIRGGVEKVMWDLTWGLAERGIPCDMLCAYLKTDPVDPEHQDMAVGRTLIGMMKERYKDFLRIAVIAYDSDLVVLLHASSVVADPSCGTCHRHLACVYP